MENPTNKYAYMDYSKIPEVLRAVGAIGFKATAVEYRQECKFGRVVLPTLVLELVYLETK